MIQPPYSVLYVDPPWSYDNKKTGGSMTSGADQQYANLSLGKLKALPIGDLCAPNAVLALWATVPFGGDPYDVIDAWGFTYKTSFFWIKTGRIGMGHYFRGNVEPLLFAVRGKVRPFQLRSQRNHIELPALGHSAKPSYFRPLVERATAHLEGPKLELFAREKAEGWDSTGLELDGVDIRTFGLKVEAA